MLMASSTQRWRPMRIANSFPSRLLPVPAQFHQHGDHGGRQPEFRSVSGAHGREGQERDRPGAHREHFPSMHAVAGDIGHGRAVAEHMAEVGEGARAGRRRLAARKQEQRDEKGAAGAAGVDKESHLPAEPDIDFAREEIGECAGNADRSGMEGDATRAHPSFELVAEHPESDHVGSRPTEAGQRTEYRAGHKVVGDISHAEMARHGGENADEVDPARLEAVGRGHQQQHRQGVHAENYPGEPAAFRIGQRPFLAEGRQQCGKGERADLPNKLGWCRR